MSTVNEQLQWNSYEQIDNDSFTASQTSWDIGECEEIAKYADIEILYSLPYLSHINRDF
jgi:hypothetical protein